MKQPNVIVCEPVSIAEVKLALRSDHAIVVDSKTAMSPIQAILLHDSLLYATEDTFKLAVDALVNYN